MLFYPDATLWYICSGLNAAERAYNLTTIVRDREKAILVCKSKVKVTIAKLLSSCVPDRWRQINLIMTLSVMIFIPSAGVQLVIGYLLHFPIFLLGM